MNCEETLPLLQHQLQQEREARKHAEARLERKNRELTRANAELREQNARLSTLYSQLETTHVHLLQTEKLAAIGQLAAGVAHEVNNPTGYMQCNLGTLERYFGELLRMVDAYEGLDPQLDPAQRLAVLYRLKQRVDLPHLRCEVAQILDECRNGIERLSKVVRSLRDFSRVDDDGKWQAANVERSLDATLHLLAPQLRANIHILREYGSVPEIECLPSQLNQVFFNLLLNASQAIEGAGHIRVRTGQEGERIWIEVEDSGCGIPEEHLGRVFDPFFSTRPIGQGSGLGLAVAFGIARSHQGELELHSEVGKGSRFRLWLPIRRKNSGMAA